MSYLLQLDIEMSFTDEERMMDLVEGLVRDTWPEKDVGPLKAGPFPRLTYHEAIQCYGSDKPNLASDVIVSYI